MALAVVVAFGSCDTGGAAPRLAAPAPGMAAVPQSPAPAQPAVPVPGDDPASASGVQVEIGNTRYLFVLGEHSVVELEALLRRADEIAQTSLDHFDELDIALVIHGPSVNLFTRGTYPQNRELIDLAAKLDAFHVIDVKICEVSMANAGVSRSEIPEFIESVPFAPDEIRRLTAEGYINL